MKAIVTVGVSTSGKSTFARDWVAKDPANRIEVNRDNIRKMLMEADGNEFAWRKWNWKREGEVTLIANKMIMGAAHSQDIVISDTNLHEGKRDTLVKWLTGLGFEVEVKEFTVAIEEAWARDAYRANGVGHSVIAKQHENWLKTVSRKVYTPAPHLPKCILVDIDGTMAHMNGKRGPFDWHAVGVDDPDHVVISVVNAMSRLPGMNVIALSGRDGVCEPETRKWLKDNSVNFKELFMRAPGDMRKDTLVKQEIFWREIDGKYNVQCVFDDRPAVIRMWQEIGVKTFVVGNPWIEF